jgi:hypothetical protein
MADAGFLVAKVEAMLLLLELQVGDEIEIEAIADPVAAGIEGADG